MASDLGLPGLQRWMQSVIVHRGPIGEALAAADAAALVPGDGITEVLRPSATLTAVERIEIYQGMYLLRMAEALESDYPALAHFLGEKRWTALVRDYVEAHPSRSHTLNVLGAALPAYLKEAPGLRHRGFCHDLARLEMAVVEAFDAEESGRLSSADLDGVPADAWETARLVPCAALRLVELGWNANAWLDSTKDDRHDHPRPRREAARLVIFRRHFAVYRRELSLPAFRLLSDLVGGFTVGASLGAALARRASPGADALGRWFRDWAADGLFARVETASPATAGPRVA
jgi:hypothetical protein